MNYETAINLNPKNSLILNNYSYYIISKENLFKAESLIIENIQITPNSAKDYDTLWMGAVSKQLLLRFFKKNYLKSCDVKPRKNGEILEHYGDVMYMLNKEKEALLFWNSTKNNFSF